MQKRLILFIALCCLFSFTWAQLPPNQPEQDCFSAIPVCQDIYTQTNSYSGAGNNPDEINGAFSCLLLGERNSVWYTFRIQTAGQLCFTISPNDSTEDYDWALFNITNSSCAAIYNDPSLQVSCSFAPPDLFSGCNGNTGANGNTALPCGGQNQACINVAVGQTYVLNVSNFTGFDNGYTLDFSASTAQLYDDTPPDMTGAGHSCDGATVSFSENILCSTVDPTDFTFSGPGGPYTVTAVRSDCDNGGTYDNTFELVVDPPISVAANYTVSLIGAVSDFCGNTANQNSQTIFLEPVPSAAINTLDPQCLEVNNFDFQYSGTEGGGIISYNWDFGDSTGAVNRNPNHAYRSSGSKDITLVIRDSNNCPDTATSSVMVYPRPNAGFAIDSAICQRDSVPYLNLTTIDSTAQIDSYLWSFGDGNFSTDPDPSHAYLEPGIHTILLTVESATNCVDTASRNILTYPLPEVAFLTEPDVCFGDPARLENISTIRDDIANDGIEGWEWNFGDGNSLTGTMTPSHIYGAPGIFDVTLTVFSDKGCRDSLVLPQEVYQTPDPDLLHDTVCFSQQAFLSVIPIEQGQVEWFEEINDSIAFHQGPNYLTPPIVFGNTYYVEVISPEECRSNRVAIEAPLHTLGDGRITASDTIIELPGGIINFSVDGSIKGDRYRWDFGDDLNSIAAAPVHEYKYPGKYLVELELTDVNGCEYELEKVIEVKKIVHVHVPSAFTPNGDGYNDEFHVGAYNIQQFAFRVFNRLGNLIFQTNDPDFKWNGQNTNGSASPEGVYVYQVKALDFDGILIEKQGTITLVR